MSARVPRSVGAALVLATLVGRFFWIGFSISDDAEVLIEKLPEAARKLRKDLSSARSITPTALQNVQEAAHELQGAATDAGAPPEASAKSATGAKTCARPAARTVTAQAPEPTWVRTPRASA